MDYLSGERIFMMSLRFGQDVAASVTGEMVVPDATLR